MLSPSKPSSVRHALVICCLVIAACGFAWLRAARDRSRLELSHQRLANRLSQLEQALAASRDDADSQKRSAAQQIEDLQLRVADLSARNEALQNSKRRKPRPEAADGQVTWVSAADRRLWINLGEPDRLGIGASFAVGHQTDAAERGQPPLARGDIQVKGSIRVTRVIGPHQAEALIEGDDRDHPIAKGDPVYVSP